VTTHRTLLLSLRPRFADAILSGTKTVELRRRPINAQPHTPIILYASSPTMAIVGTARLGEVHAHTPAAAWKKHRKSLGLSRAEFDAYLDGSPYAYVLLLQRICVLNEPLSLRSLRQEGAFQPPQSFRYVAATDPHQLHGLIPTQDMGAGDPWEIARPATVRKPTTASGISSAPAPAKTSPRSTSRDRPIWTIADS
jgi:predicted transcriptional regulator